MSNEHDIELTNAVTLRIKVQEDKKHCSDRCPFHHSVAGSEHDGSTLGKLCYRNVCQLFWHQEIAGKYYPSYNDPTGTRLPECIQAFGE